MKDLLSEFEKGNEGAGYTQPASSNDLLSEFEHNQNNNNTWYGNNDYTAPQDTGASLSDFETGPEQTTTQPVHETPEYSVQEAAEQAISFINTH